MVWCNVVCRVLQSAVCSYPCEEGKFIWIGKTVEGKQMSLRRNRKSQLHQRDGFWDPLGRKKCMGKERTRCHSVFVTE